ncbi:MAG: 50S ribosomal protein L6 [Clostridiales bacterium]|nr:50S ribosomal protein L6 [Bacillota bacterium]NLL54119.1 50S ribosomal protein L6 [Clostridiales bacterium]
MSRIGKLPINVPAGVTVTIDKENLVTVKGPKGTLNQKVHADITVRQEGDQILVTRPSDSKPHRSLHGLYRSLINNMVTGVTAGFSKALVMEGVGYRATVQGPDKLTLAVGYSHPVVFDAPEGCSFETPTPTRIVVRGIEKQVVGAIAADIRKVRKPEPYLGKGIRYENEQIRRKEGKAGK